MARNSALAFLRLHVVGLALLVLERAISQLARPNVGDGIGARLPFRIGLSVNTLRPGDDAQSAHRLIVDWNAPGNFGGLLAPNRLLSALMDVGDQDDVWNDAFRVALQDQSIRQLADQVVFHTEVGSVEPDRRP